MLCALSVVLVLALPAAPPPASNGEDAVVRAAAIRAIAQSGASNLYPQIYRAARSRDDVVREAVVDALISIEARPSAQAYAMLDDADEHVREVGVRYLAKRSKAAELDSLITRALGDRAARVQLQGIALASARKTASAIPALRRIASSGVESGELSQLASVEAMTALADLVAAREVAEATWRRAADELRELGDEGFAVLVDAISRSPEPRRNVLIQRYTLGAM